MTKRWNSVLRTSELCQRLGEIAGIGPVTATALVAAVGDRSYPKQTCSRSFSCTPAALLLDDLADANCVPDLCSLTRR
jgi:hypothetical protein